MTSDFTSDVTEGKRQLNWWDFPGSPVVKNLPCNAGDGGSVPGGRAKIPQATEQLSTHTATREPVCHNERHCMTG